MVLILIVPFPGRCLFCFQYDEILELNCRFLYYLYALYADIMYKSDKSQGLQISLFLMSIRFLFL